MENKNECGILILALCHPYYGRMAYNLAMSIKSRDIHTSITLVYNRLAVSHINNDNMWVFDNKMEIPDDKIPFGKKLEIYNFSPYERTIYLDADTLWVNKSAPSALFDQLRGIPFTGITEGFHDYSDPSKSDPSKHYFFWADLDEIKKEYEIKNTIFQWRSEFLYFEKCQKTKELFDCAIDIYSDTGLDSIKMFADYIPDEIAFNIACGIHGIAPHKYKWQPSYWDRLHGGNIPPIEELNSKYYIISCGSNANYGALKRVYDRVTAASAYKIKLQHVFPLISKKEMLTTRQLM